MDKTNTNQLLVEIQPTEKSVVVYKSEDGTVQLEVQLVDDNVWLTQAQMADLFQKDRTTITRHINNAFKTNEVDKKSNVRFLHIAFSDKPVKFYSLDVIIAVGYRVKSQRGTDFRKWALPVIKDYMLKGYAVNQRFERLEQRVAKTEEKIDFFVKSALPPTEGIFFNGQIFDAYNLISDLIRKSKREIILIDNYIDDSVLKMLDKRNVNVPATIYTAGISEKLQLDLAKHNSQYSPINIKTFKKFHDRFLIIDNDVYHIGASIKDLGKSVFAFSKLGLEKKIILSIL